MIGREFALAPWLSAVLARRARALAACTTDEARIGVLRASMVEAALRGRLDISRPILDAMLVSVADMERAVADAETEIARREAADAAATPVGTDGAGGEGGARQIPPCGDAGHHGRALALHGRCVACEEAAAMPARASRETTGTARTMAAETPTGTNGTEKREAKP